MIRRIDRAPGTAAHRGPYSQAVVANGFVFVTGQTPFRGEADIAPEAFEDQVRACIDNLTSVLHEAGSDLESVVKVNAFLTAPEQREPFNRVYAEYFSEAKPARTTVCVSIWEIALEIECVAVVTRASGAASGEAV